MQQAARPQTLPADARWSPEEREWIVGEEQDGARTGPFRHYRADGTLAQETRYVAGIEHGPFRRFHENGEVSQCGEMRNGKRHGLCTWTRSTGPTTELTIPPQCDDGVWSAARRFKDDMACPVVLYDRHGREVNPDGTLVPQRPDCVDDGAAYLAAEGRWFTGYTASNERPTERRGLWRWWDKGGTLLRETVYDDTGAPAEDSVYRSGKLVNVERYAKGKMISEILFDLSGYAHTERAYDYSEGALRSFSITRNGAVRLTASGIESESGKRRLFHHRFLYPDGQIEAEGPGTRDTPLGSWKFFSPGGDLLHHVEIPEDADFGSLNEDFNPQFLLGNCQLDSLKREAETGGGQSPDWSEIEGAYSEEVQYFPLFLRELTSSEASIRLVALASIEDEVIHQGTVYPATAAVLPSLIDTLHEEGSDQAGILTLIARIAAAAFPCEGPQVEAEDPESPVPDICRTIRSSFPVFRSFIGEGPISRRIAAIRLVGYVETTDAATALQAITVLQGIIRDERDPVIRCTALFTLLSRMDAAPEIADPFLHDEDVVADLLEDPLLRLVAAIQSGLRFGPAASPWALEIMTDFLMRWEPPEDRAAERDEVAERYGQLPFVSDHILADISLSLGCIGSKEARKYLHLLSPRIEAVDPVSATTFGRGLLALAFNNGRLPFAAGFADVLKTLAESQNFFYFINATDVLADWNLPRDARGLGDLYKKIILASDPEKAMHAVIHGMAGDGWE